MEILRTPDKCFENIKGYTFDPVYTNITAKDGTKIRVHHIMKVQEMVHYY